MEFLDITSNAQSIYIYVYEHNKEMEKKPSNY